MHKCTRFDANWVLFVYIILVLLSLSLPLFWLLGSIWTPTEKWAPHFHIRMEFSRSEFMISSRAKRACITWTARGLSQMQNSMRHKSLHEYMLGVRHWRHVALRHESNDFAFPGNIDFAADDQRIFMYLLFMKGSCVYSSMKQCLQSVNHEQSPIQMTQNNNHNKWLEILDFQPKLLWRMPT